MAPPPGRDGRCLRCRRSKGAMACEGPVVDAALTRVL